MTTPQEQDEARWFIANATSLPEHSLHAPPRGAGPEQRLAMLARMLEIEVIPRLVLARRPAPAGCPALDPYATDAPAADALAPSGRTSLPGSGLADRAGRPGMSGGVTAHIDESASHAAPPTNRADILAFADLLLERDEASAIAHVAALHDRGASLETLYLDLLTPAAQHLGTLWEEDLCDFTRVTLAIWRLQQVLRALSPGFQGDSVFGGNPGRVALLAPTPGSSHTFGLLMVVEFFRRARWDVWSGALASPADLAGRVNRDWYAVVGLSLAHEAGYDGLVACIAEARRASRNPAVNILVGGPLFVEHPELVARAGADGTAVDGRCAAEEAERLFAVQMANR
jgi:methanogenic corrinoid protein MtbC1